MDSSRWRIQQLFDEGDTLLAVYYASGLVIGVGILACFSIFPGPEDRQAPQASSEGKVDRETTTAIDDDNGAVQALSDFDQLKPEHVEKIRKKFRLTTEQMTNVIQRAQSQNCQFGGGRSLSFNSDDWTPHQQLNAMVYCILLSVLAFTIYRDYGDWIVICFARAFPKEASVLGFQLDRKDIVGSPS